MIKKFDEFLNEKLSAKEKDIEKTIKDTPEDVANKLQMLGYTPRRDGLWEHPDGRQAWPDKKGKWMSSTKMPGVSIPVMSI